LGNKTRLDGNGIETMGDTFPVFSLGESVTNVGGWGSESKVPLPIDFLLEDFNRLNGSNLLWLNFILKFKTKEMKTGRN